MAKGPWGRKCSNGDIIMGVFVFHGADDGALVVVPLTDIQIVRVFHVGAYSGFAPVRADYKVGC